MGTSTGFVPPRNLKRTERLAQSTLAQVAQREDVHQLVDDLHMLLLMATTRSLPRYIGTLTTTDLSGTFSWRFQARRPEDDVLFDLWYTIGYRHTLDIAPGTDRRRYLFSLFVRLEKPPLHPEPPAPPEAHPYSAAGMARAGVCAPDGAVLDYDSLRDANTDPQVFFDTTPFPAWLDALMQELLDLQPSTMERGMARGEIQAHLIQELLERQIHPTPAPVSLPALRALLEQKQPHASSLAQAAIEARLTTLIAERDAAQRVSDATDQALIRAYRLTLDKTQPLTAFDTIYSHERRREIARDWAQQGFPPPESIPDDLRPKLDDLIAEAQCHLEREAQALRETQSAAPIIQELCGVIGHGERTKQPDETWRCQRCGVAVEANEPSTPSEQDTADATETQVVPAPSLLRNANAEGNEPRPNGGRPSEFLN